MTKKQTMKKWMFTFVLILTASFPVSDWAQSKNALVGTWKLISATDTTDEGQVIRNAYGLNPIGFLTYTPDGRMMAIITNGGRKPLSVPDWVGAPVEERAQALATLVAYAGRYSLDGDKVTHHLEAAWMQNAVNMDLIRFIVKSRATV